MGETGRLGSIQMQQRWSKIQTPRMSTPLSCGRTTWLTLPWTGSVDCGASCSFQPTCLRASLEVRGCQTSQSVVVGIQHSPPNPRASERGSLPLQTPLFMIGKLQKLHGSLKAGSLWSPLRCNEDKLEGRFDSSVLTNLLCSSHRSELSSVPSSSCIRPQKCHA